MPPEVWMNLSTRADAETPRTHSGDVRQSPRTARPWRCDSLLNRLRISWGSHPHEGKGDHRQTLMALRVGQRRHIDHHGRTGSEGGGRGCGDAMFMLQSSCIMEEYGCLGRSVGTWVHRLSSTGNTLTAHRTPHTLPLVARWPDACALRAMGSSHWSWQVCDAERDWSSRWYATICS